MASPVARLPSGDPIPPAADPVAIRASLTLDVAAAFVREWEIALERAKQTKDLAGVHDLLNKWRHLAYAELREPGTYFRLLATTAHTLATGEAPAGSVSGADMKDLIRQRLGKRT